MGEKAPKDVEYTFTGHFIQDEENEPKKEPKKEIHIHIEHLENLDLEIQM